MGLVKDILLRVRAVHYGGVTNQMAEAFGTFRGTAGKWFSPTKPSIPEAATCRAIEAKHPAEAAGLFAAWEAESKQTQRAIRRAPRRASAFFDLDPGHLRALPQTVAAASPPALTQSAPN